MPNENPTSSADQMVAQLVAKVARRFPLMQSNIGKIGLDEGIRRLVATVQASAALSAEVEQMSSRSGGSPLSSRRVLTLVAVHADAVAALRARLHMMVILLRDCQQSGRNLERTADFAADLLRSELSSIRDPDIGVCAWRILAMSVIQFVQMGEVSEAAAGKWIVDNQVLTDLAASAYQDQLASMVLAEWTRQGLDPFP